VRVSTSGPLARVSLYVWASCTCECPRLTATLQPPCAIQARQSSAVSCCRFDFDKRHVLYDTTVPILMILGDYEISGRILLLPISGKGAINITLSKYAKTLLPLQPRERVWDSRTIVVAYCWPSSSILILRRMASFGMLHRVALVRTDVSDKLSASFIRVTRIGELGTTLAVTNNRRTLRRNTHFAPSVFLRSVRRLLVTANVVSSSPILVTLMMGALSSPKLRFLQEPHGVTSQKTTFFIVTAVRTSNLTLLTLHSHILPNFAQNDSTRLSSGLSLL
jgi:hypothetical protein